MPHGVAAVPPGHMWLEGDNPSNSTDSRSYGAVPQAMLQGRVWLKLWPLTQFGRITREQHPTNTGAATSVTATHADDSQVAASTGSNADTATVVTHNTQDSQQRSNHTAHRQRLDNSGATTQRTTPEVKVIVVAAAADTPESSKGATSTAQ